MMKLNRYMSVVLMFRILTSPLTAQNIPYGTNDAAAYRLNVGDANIYYEVYGEGRPVVLLHGGFAYIDQFKDYIPILSKKYKVIAIATRGYGRSDIGTENYTFGLLADDVKAVIQKESRDKAIIIGFSDGARISYVVAVKHPEIVHKVVAMCGWNQGTSGYTQKGLDWLENYRPEEFEYYRPDLKNIMPQPKRWNHFMENLKIIWSEKEILPLDNLKNITCPFLILAPDRDEFSKLERLVEVYQRIPNAQLAVFPNSTHSDVSPRNITILEQYILKFIE